MAGQSLEMTGFAIAFDTALCLDLTAPPYEAHSQDWLHPTDYNPCHSNADEARKFGYDAIPSLSARDPAGSINISLLICAAFAEPAPTEYQTWHMKLSDTGVLALSEHSSNRLHYPMSAFIHDPRVAAPSHGGNNPA